MDDILRLSMVSPESTVYEGEIAQVTLPGSLGSFTILPRHAPIVSSLQAGEIEHLAPVGTLHELGSRGGSGVRCQKLYFGCHVGNVEGGMGVQGN